MYGKLFASAFTGSLVGRGSDVFAVLAYLVANQDAKGFVEVNPHLVGVAIGCGTEAVESALAFLESPDPGSRTTDEEGRRIVREGRFLFRLVNGPKYRAIRDEDARREYQREWDRKNRPSGHARRLASVRSGPTQSDPIRPKEKEKKKKRESERAASGVTRALAEASSKKRHTVEERTPPTVEEWLAYVEEKFPAWSRSDAENAFDHYEAVGWKIGTKPVRDWRASARTCYRRFLERNPNVDPTRVIW